MAEEVEENIKVVVRVRDLIAREKDQPKVNISSLTSNFAINFLLSQAFMVADATEIIQKSTNKTWNFDRVYSPVEDNRSIYADTAASMIESTISGFNATIFAYGQTSSGEFSWKKNLSGLSVFLR